MVKTKHCKVASLATKDENAPIGKKSNRVVLSSSITIPVQKSAYEAQHLYFTTTTENVAKSDWLTDGITIRQAKESIINSLWVDVVSNERKIEATTDPSLVLPSIPESFLKKYVACNGTITDIELSMWSGDEPSIYINSKNEVIVVEKGIQDLASGKKST